MLIRALWHQWTFRYGFGARGLVIREGLIFRNVRQIEYQRIENIDTERGLLHRLLNVAQVRVQTSTGGKPEALISVLDLGAVQEMRQRVFADTRPTAEAAKAPEEPRLLHLPPMELVRYGLIDNRGMILVAAGAGLLQQAGFFRVNREVIDHWLQSSALTERRRARDGDADHARLVRDHLGTDCRAYPFGRARADNAARFHAHATRRGSSCALWVIDENRSHAADTPNSGGASVGVAAAPAVWQSVAGRRSCGRQRRRRRSSATQGE